jgi:hypothetical protein
VKKKIGVRELARLARVPVGTVDPAARSLSVRKATFRIGVCLPGHFLVFYDQIQEGILNEAGRFRQKDAEIDYQPTNRLGIGKQRR